MNILLVDDQPTKLLTYEAVLSELGENLIPVRSGIEALEQPLKKDIALVPRFKFLRPKQFLDC